MPAIPPATTARQQPAGLFNGIADGFGGKIAFNRAPAVAIWEKKVKPFSIDGGDPIEQSTNWNALVRTFSTRVLIKLEEITVEAGYDSDCYSDIMTKLINAEGAITVYWRTGDKLDFYGALRKFELSDHTEGDKPMATLTIAFTNRDANGLEVLPVYTAAAGT